MQQLMDGRAAVAGTAPGSAPGSNAVRARVPVRHSMDGASRQLESMARSLTVIPGARRWEWLRSSPCYQLLLPVVCCGLACQGAVGCMAGPSGFCMYSLAVLGCAGLSWRVQGCMAACDAGVVAFAVTGPPLLLQLAAGA